MTNFDANKAAEHIVEWIRNKMNTFGTNSKCVIGISGGKDSTVVAALCVAALGKERIYGVLMPNGHQADIDDSYKVVDLLDINYTVVNIKETVDAVKHTISDATFWPELSEQADINLPARIRMVTLYAVAQTLGNAFVVNTCNLSEDYVGYNTKYGDSAGDFSPLAKYTSEEVIAIGDALGLPPALTHKTPSDGLCGKSDEDNLGFTYKVLNRYIRTGEIDDDEAKKKIDRLHIANLHKLEPIDSPKWRS